MAVQVIPTLATMADVYRLPRTGGPDSERFRAYADLGRSRAPVSGYNPMTSADVGSTIDALLAIDAEALLRRTADEWAPRLGLTADVEMHITVATPGMWTNRLLTEIEHRLLGRTWPQVLLWTGEPVSTGSVTAEAVAQLVRATWHHHHGPPATATDAAGQEGLATALATADYVDDAEDAAIFEALDIVGSDDTLATMVALLYGDDAARQGGWTALGLAPSAGLAASSRAAHRALAHHEPDTLIKQRWTPRSSP